MSNEAGLRPPNRRFDREMAEIPPSGDAEHLAILRQGAEVWNAWRGKNPGLRPDLTGLNLAGANLGGAFLADAILAGSC